MFEKSSSPKKNKKKTNLLAVKIILRGCLKRVLSEKVKSRKAGHVLLALVSFTYIRIKKVDPLLQNRGLKLYFIAVNHVFRLALVSCSNQ